MTLKHAKSHARPHDGSLSSIHTYRRIRLQSSSHSKSSLRRGALIGKKSYLEYIEGSSGELIPTSAKSSEDRATIMKALNNHFIFSSLTEEDKEMIAESMQVYAFMPEMIVFKQFMPSRSYYIIKSGCVDVVVNNRKVNRIYPGEGFGELALLHDNPRSATIKCVEFTILWVLEREMFRKVIEDISTQQFEQNRQFLEQVDLLSSLNPSEKDALASHLTCNKYLNGQNIFCEGDSGEQLFIVKEGTVSVRRANHEVNRLYPGNYFGEDSMMNSSIRNVTCTAVEGQVKCLCLSKELLSSTLNYNLMEIIDRNAVMLAITYSERLSSLRSVQKQAIMNHLCYYSFNSGEVVIPKGTLCSKKIYFILSGALQNSKSLAIVASKGQCLGELFVDGRNDLKYEHDIVAEGSVKIGEITQFQFELDIGGKFEDIVKQNLALEILRKISLFNHFDDKQLKYLLSIVKIQKFPNKEIIIREGQPSASLFVVKKGKVEVLKSGKRLRTVTKLSYFSERNLLDKTISSYTYVAEGATTVWIFNNQDLSKIVNDQIKEYINKRTVTEDENFDLKDYKIIQQLGKGLFARVYLVKNPQGRCFALKAYSRRKVEVLALQQKLIVMHKQNEHQILSQVDHQFIVKYIKTFKDERRIYFMMEYVNGFDFDVVLRNAGILSSRDTAFYAGSLIIILQYLHERDILYRDLKPENIMIDKDGYVKLIDFNNSKICQGKTYTIVGSPYYTSPDVIVGKGYGKSADIWSLGVIIYEMMCGKVPFGQTQEDPLKVYEEILTCSVAFPEDGIPLSEVSKGLILLLISKFTERFNASIEKLQKHEFFSNFDWEELYCNKIVPPFKPDVQEDTEFSEEESEDSEHWDIVIENDSLESAEEQSEISDEEIEEYKSCIPYNWDKDF